MAVAIGAGGLLKELAPMVLRYFGARGSTIEQDERLYRQLKNIELPPDYVASGYNLVKCPVNISELVARSRNVDAFLRKSELTASENESHLEKLNEKLAANSKMYELALLCQYRKSRRSYPPRDFFNEKKACLGTDLLVGVKDVDLFQGSYFHSFLTNETATKSIESVGANPVRQFGGPDIYPIDEGSGGKLVLKSIANSRMGNHIGISTLIHTSDGQLVMWRQSGSSQQNRGRLVPAGSGSCDWKDWTACSQKSTGLLGLIAYAMQREFVEESTDRGDKLNESDLETKVLGFFRWMSRGGKPEFVGISKLAYPASFLKANATEVNDPDHVQTAFPARTIEQLRASIQELMDRTNISIPLWVCLQCLVEAIEEDENHIVQFLGIEPAIV